MGGELSPATFLASPQTHAPIRGCGLQLSPRLPAAAPPLPLDAQRTMRPPTACCNACTGSTGHTECSHSTHMLHLAPYAAHGLRPRGVHAQSQIGIAIGVMLGIPHGPGLDLDDRICSSLRTRHTHAEVTPQHHCFPHRRGRCLLRGGRGPSGAPQRGPVKAYLEPVACLYLF